MRRSDRDSHLSTYKIRRRAFMVGGLQLGVMGVLVARMRQLQIEQSEQFRLLAEENRINMRLLPPARGLIYDRNGVLLAGNEPNYRIYITREDAGDVDLVLGRLQKILNLPDENLVDVRRELNRRSSFVPITVADRLPWADFAQVAANAPALPGITPDVGLSRIYPLDEDFAHVVGYVGPVSDFDLQRIDDDDPLLQIPRFQIGKTGVEHKLERDLRGKAGTKRVEVNAAGRIMRELDRVEGTSGDNVQLTIDHHLQNYAEARLVGESAAAVVMDVNTGEVTALASAPTFDPNLFVRGISSAAYNELLNNPYRPLANKTVQGTYPPGSTFKMVTALAALQDGVIELDETVSCRGFVELGDRRFHCWKRGGHGRMNLRDSLKESCDVYYYDVAQRVGIDKIAEMAVKLGLGVQYDLPLNAVSEGLVPSKSWKSEVRGEEWRIGDTLNACIGQGYVLTSPLQQAVMTARLATGRAVMPTMVRTINGVAQTPPQAERLEINPAHLRAVVGAMDAVVNERGGTAHASRVLDATMQYAGKTGTSQVRNISAAERAAGVISNEDLPWERRDHALFVGFGPIEAPRYAVSVVVEHGGGGSAAAAPIARDILSRALHGDLPPLSAFPSNLRDRIARERDQLNLRPAVTPDINRIRA